MRTAIEVSRFEQYGKADLRSQGLRFPRLRRILLLLHLLQHCRSIPHQCCWIRDTGILFPRRAVQCREV